MPEYTSIWNRKRGMGCDRSKVTVLSGRVVSFSHVLLPCWSYCTCHPVGFDKAMAQLLFPVHQVRKQISSKAASLRCHFSSLSLPVIIAGTGPIPPATEQNYIPWTIVGFVFQYWIRRRAFSWWTKYNCKSRTFPVDREFD